MRISDAIEQFIKEMMEKDNIEIELQRNELAEYFRCAPSQINYVLSTRFTPDHGYITESKRGGGGFIRITRMVRDNKEYLSYLLAERIADEIDARSAQALCTQLAEKEIISIEDARLIYSAVCPQTLSFPIPESLKDRIRAKTMRQMLLCIAKRAVEE